MTEADLDDLGEAGLGSLALWPSVPAMRAEAARHEAARLRVAARRARLEPWRAWLAELHHPKDDPR